MGKNSQLKPLSFTIIDGDIKLKQFIEHCRKRFVGGETTSTGKPLAKLTMQISNGDLTGLVIEVRLKRMEGNTAIVAASWRYNFDRTSTFVLGHYIGAEPMSLAEARTAHQQAYDIRRNGGVLKRETAASRKRAEQEASKAAEEAPTLNRLWAVRQATFEDRAPKLFPGYLSVWRKWIASSELASTPLVEVTYKRLFDHLISMREAGAGPEPRRRAIFLLNGLCDYAMKTVDGWSLPKMLNGADVDVFSKGELNRERNRYLRISELRDLWKLTDTGGAAHQAIRFIIATGVRKSEACNASFDEIDLERGLWTVPASRMKQGKVHMVKLNSVALAVLNQQREIHGDAGWVFPSPSLAPHRRKSPVAGKSLNNAQDTLNNQMGTTAEKWTIHDLRRTAATYINRDRDAGGIGLSLHVTDEMLAHATKTKLQRTYMVNAEYHISTEAISGFMAWGEWLEANVINPPPTSDVTAIRRKKA
ncbi:tyrosine-type recombinase/integrase [Type-E symbiont of Plautia stali]|uniref:tyrosine-type recombinase/integrase n=1 Tax=Type-E symbiont of Plautia stali TaxID=1560357 RepID=UPI00073F8472|nr:site-specific integrase [Type-E symbiont of Plautia stali]